MIDATAVAYIMASLMGAWMSGFGIGKAVAFTRRIASSV